MIWCRDFVADGKRGKELILEHQTLRLTGAGLEALARELPAWLDRFAERHRSPGSAKYRIALTGFSLDPAARRPLSIRDLAAWHGHLARYRDKLIHVRRADDILQARREAKPAVMLGFQNGIHLNRDLRNVDCFYDLGIRQVQLTYNDLNALRSVSWPPRAG